MKHWRRNLADGGVEFFMLADDGTRCEGTVAPEEHADEIQAMFEQATGCQLPPPEIKQARHGRSVGAS